MHRPIVLEAQREEDIEISGRERGRKSLEEERAERERVLVKRLPVILQSEFRAGRAGRGW